MTPNQKHDLLGIEFDLEKLSEDLPQDDPARFELKRALLMINRAIRHA